MLLQQKSTNLLKPISPKIQSDLVQKTKSHSNISKPLVKLSKKTKRALPQKPMKMGALSFDVDDDVNIYVDGKFIPKKQLKNFKIKAGLRRVRMVKEGFDPIINKIKVQPGKTTKIRARGGA